MDNLRSNGQPSGYPLNDRANTSTSGSPRRSSRLRQVGKHDAANMPNSKAVRVAKRGIAPVASRPARIDWTPGGIYVSRLPDGSYKCFKVLAVEDDVVHIKPCLNRYGYKPRAADINSLFACMEHAPVSRRGLEQSGAELITSTPVTEEELDACQEWADDPLGGHFF